MAQLYGVTKGTEMVSIQTATVYKGGNRRWFSKKAAVNAEARMCLRLAIKRKRRCDCDKPDYSGGYLYPGNTCQYHEPDAPVTQRYLRYSRSIIERYLATPEQPSATA